MKGRFQLELEPREDKFSMVEADKNQSTIFEQLRDDCKSNIFGEMSVDEINRIVTIDFEQYTIERQLGSESKNGYVHCIKNTKTSKLYALKGINDLNEARRELFALRSLRDVRGVSKLAKQQLYFLSHNSCSSAVLLLGDAKYFLVSVLYKCDLTDYIKSHPALPLSDKIILFYRILLALTEVRRLGFHNADLKPDNILLFESQNENGINVLDIAITDFGDFNPNSYLSNNTFGTESSIAPEQASSSPCNRFKAEIWQLGVMFYTLLYSELPFGEAPIQRYYDEYLVLTFSINSRFSDPIYKAICSYDFVKNQDPLNFARSLKGCFGRMKNLNFDSNPYSDKLWWILSRMMHPNPENRATLNELVGMIEQILPDIDVDSDIDSDVAAPHKVFSHFLPTKNSSPPQVQSQSLHQYII